MAIRKAGIEVDAVRTTIDAWRAVLPVQDTQDDDLSAALDAVKNRRLGVLGCDVMGRSAQRAGVRHLLTRTSRMALNWRELDLSIRSKQRRIG